MSQLELREKRQHNLEICIAGVGGAGNNVVKYLREHSEMDEACFLAINTDTQVLREMNPNDTLEIYSNSDDEDRGLGAGGKPDYGRAAAEACKDAIVQKIGRPKIMLVIAGMGGGTGTGAAPVLASIAREQGILCVGIGIMPFKYESNQKRAREGLKNLAEQSNSYIVLYNQELFSGNGDGEADMLMDEAYAKFNKYIADMLNGLYAMLITPGECNIDFADFRSTTSNGGRTLIGSGIASDADHLEEAVQQAIHNPLLGVGRKIVAKKGMMHLIGPVRTTSHEKIMRLITKNITDEIDMISGFTSCKEPEAIKLCLVLVSEEQRDSLGQYEDDSPLTNYLIGSKNSDIQRLDVMSFYRENLRSNQDAA